MRAMLLRSTGLIVDREDPLILTDLPRPVPLEGEILDKLPALTSFPGDFDTFWPEGRVWQS